jgi:hypothetical protein
MNTLTIFSEKERQYFQYQARQEYLREQSTIQKEQQAAFTEIERLKALLAQKK